jgi:hypothetical protein
VRLEQALKSLEAKRGMMLKLETGANHLRLFAAIGSNLSEASDTFIGHFLFVHVIPSAA